MSLRPPLPASIPEGTARVARAAPLVVIAVTPPVVIGVQPPAPQARPGAVGTPGTPSATPAPRPPSR